MLWTSRRVVSLVLPLLPLTTLNAAPVEVPEEGLQPGLLAVYRSLADDSAVIHRIEPKPAFYLGESSPHPRLPPGRFEVTWIGTVQLKELQPITFDARVCGEIAVQVDGVNVLEGRGNKAQDEVIGQTALRRPPGLYRFWARYRSLDGKPARLQIGWQSPAFAREPLPAWRLHYLLADMPAAAIADQRIARGREAAGRLGCARCHSGSMPGLQEPPPGPSLSGAGKRLDRAWLLNWLEAPAKLRPGAHMPVLFAANRRGLIERWLIVEALAPEKERNSEPPPGEHRAGRLAFIRLGCHACHVVPDIPADRQPGLDRSPFIGLGDRFSPADLARFITNPRARYPDGRMPHLPVALDEARDIAAFLLLWSKPSAVEALRSAPWDAEITAVIRDLGARDRASAGAGLLHLRGCTACHAGLEAPLPADVAIRKGKEDQGCLAPNGRPRFSLDATTRTELAAYVQAARREKHASAFYDRSRLLARAGCVRCHQRDTDKPPSVEEAGSSLGGSLLQDLPFQRTPRLTYPHQKYMRSHLAAAVRDGVRGLRPQRYTYRMPTFGDAAPDLVRALAESDGELPEETDAPGPAPLGPTDASVEGPLLAGFQGYACVSCHAWKGTLLAETDPGAVAPDLTRVVGRIRREWFERYLEDPARSHPGTPMPAIFPRGQPAPLRTVLDGDPVRQKEALWSYFALGTSAPSPKPPPPLPVHAPRGDDSPLIAQVPIRVAGSSIESISVLSASNDLLVYDLGRGCPAHFFTGAQILRTVQGRLRYFSASGASLKGSLAADSALQMRTGGKSESPSEVLLQGYDQLADGVRLRWSVRFASGTVKLDESLHLPAPGAERRLVRSLAFRDVPNDCELEVRSGIPEGTTIEAAAGAHGKPDGQVFVAMLKPDTEGRAKGALHLSLPPVKPAPPWHGKALADSGALEGSLERPGYRAVAYPRPKLPSGEDRVMPAAVAVRPRDGKVFVASLKTGELFRLQDSADASGARFVNYGGLYQEALSLLAEDDGLYVLHRRNLTRILDTDGDGKPDRFDRIAALPHGIAETYDYAYGLARDRLGGLVLSYAPYANRSLAGSGGAVRLLPGKRPQEIAFGFRNPLGWCAGPGGEVFFTDNQGEWVATNKLCHLVEGRFYGFPNPAQRQHTARPAGKTAVWVPYGWARSINGVTWDNTEGKFGPFAGQFFLAELMFGGAILRAQLEKVNGEYQGACFPFWSKGLMGPLSLAFDRRGKLYVGSITEPGWMAQPDRGALYRIDYAGPTPFEIESIRIRPRGFRLIFTSPVEPATARQVASYRVEHYRYEHTGAYGSPELDRTTAAISSVTVAADGRSVELTIGPPLKDRVYMISAPGVRSPKGMPLVHPEGAYTVNEVPAAE